MPPGANAAAESDRAASSRNSSPNRQTNNGDDSANAEIRDPSSIGPESWAVPRNGLQQLGVATTTLPRDPQLLWKFPTEYGVVAAPAIVGNEVYVAALSGKLLCFDRMSGMPIWSYRSIDDPDPKAFAPGFRAAPAVTGDAVYVGDEDGVLHAVDRVTGRKRWTFPTGAEIAGSAVVVDDSVLVGSHDSFLYCLTAADGSVVWKFQTDDMINCSPAVAGGFAFVAGCDMQLRAIDLARGEQKTAIPLGDDAYLVASPAVAGDMLYVGSRNGSVVGVDWNKQEIVWTYRNAKRLQPFLSSVAVTDKYVLIGGRDKQLHCMERDTGKPVWTFPTRGRVDSSPVVVGERVFFGSADGNVYGVGLEDGKQVWKYNAGADITAAPAVGEGVLVIGAESGDGAVYCFGEKKSD